VTNQKLFRGLALIWAVGTLAALSYVTLAGGACRASSPSAASTPTPRPFAPVQCRDTGDCPGSLCFASIPGGVCVSCADNAGCPMGTTCSSDPAVPAAAACLQACASNEDCHPGLFCSPTHVCVPKACGPGLPACEAPWVCGNQNLCARPKCSDGCPAPFVCGNAGFCVEP